MRHLDLLTRLRLITGIAHVGAGALLRFYPALAWTGGYTALLLFHIPILSDTNLAPLVARFFYLVLAILIVRGVAPKRLITKDYIDRLLEARAGLAHRPLQVLNDHPFGRPTPAQNILWDQATNRAKAESQAITAPNFPHPVFPLIDPYGTRFAILLALIIGFLFAAENSANRIQSGLSPFSPSLSPLKQTQAILHITPPSYTGWPDHTTGASSSPSLDNPAANTPLIAGTTIRAQSSATGLPSLLMVGWTPYLLRTDIQTAQRTRTLILQDRDIPKQGVLTLWQDGRRLIAFPFSKYIDHPPQVATGPNAPNPNGQGILRVPFQAADDFGIEQADIIITPRQTEAPLPVLARQEYIHLPFLTPPATTLRPVILDLDLGASFSAGADVNLDITVKDHLGQTASLSTQIAHIPERHFRNPLARQLVTLRRDLIAHGFQADQSISKALQILLMKPQIIPDDPTTILSLRVAAERLLSKQINDDDRRSVATLLWHAALRAENGGFEIQETFEKIRQAQQKLIHLLTQENLNDSDLDAALQDLSQALTESLQAMVKHMAEQQIDPRLQDMLTQFPDLQSQMFNTQSLSDILRQLRADIKTGKHDQARDLLQRLQNMMSQINNAQTTMPEAMTDLMDMIDHLQRILTAERALQTKTDQTNENDLTNLTNDQIDIAKDLQGIMSALEKRLPFLPPTFFKAHNAMTNAAQALKKQDKITAINEETRAIHELEQQQQQATQNLMSLMKQMVMFPNLGNPLSQGNADDAGHRQNINSQTIDIPEQTRARLRSILQKLRDQNTQSLPRDERQYLERLLNPYE